MFTTNHPIKMWAEDDRPREKMLLKGKNNLSNAELLAIILGSGTKTKSALDLAKEVLTASNNCLYKLGKLSIHELKEFKGIGDAKGVALAAALELGRRRKETDRKSPKKIRSSSEAYQFFRPYFEDLDYEEFRVLGLSRSNSILGTSLISKGGRSGTIADGKIIFKTLLDMKASGCILCHNHPSGALHPSERDINLTKQLRNFAELIDLPILDHIIISDNGYYSFSDKGLL